MHHSLRIASSFSAGLLLVLCGITASTGVSQQSFELVASPAEYAAALSAAALWLRTLIAIDDLFIAAYAMTTVLLVSSMARGRLSPMHWLALGLGVAAAGLDFAENHHLLALLRWAQLGQPIPPEEILQRSELSHLKWMLGHTAFVAIGILLPAPRNAIGRLFRGSLLFVQLPIGALAWAVDEPNVTFVLAWARYGTFISGFAIIAWLARVGFGEGERDEPV